MKILKRWLGTNDPLPDWASFFTAEEVRSFTTELRRDLAGRGFPHELDPQAGTLQITPPGAEPQQLTLISLAQVCRATPLSDWPNSIKRHLDAMISALTDGRATVDQLGDDFDRARPLLRLRLYQDEYLESGVPMVYRTLAEGLIAVLVYDLPQSIATVPPDHLANWTRTEEELFQIGLQNVWSAGKLEHTTALLPEGATLDLLTDYRNPYAETHLLYLQEYLETVPRAGVLAAVPGRGQVILHRIEGIQVMEALNSLLRAVPEIFLERTSALSPHLYWWRDGTFKLLPSLSEDGQINFRPPAEFMEMLNGLSNEG